MCINPTGGRNHQYLLENGIEEIYENSLNSNEFRLFSEEVISLGFLAS
jgi:hypothetical protein